MSWSDRFAARLGALDRGEPPVKKPSGLQYGVNDIPPTAVTWLNAIQQVAIIAIYLIYPLLLFRAAAIPPELSANLLSIGFLVLGVATFFQTFPKGPVGSGYMCPATFTATFVGPALSAVKLGGLPLLFGMTLFAGVIESLLSRLLSRLRALLPAEISGFVVLMVGVTAGVAGVRTLLGAGGPQQISDAEWVVAIVTLTTMVGLNVWATGLWRMMCALAGLVVGYVAAAGVGLIADEQLHAFLATPIVAVPNFSHLSWSFDVTLAVPFVIASLALTLKAVGTVTLCQRLNDEEWVRPDMASNSRGVLADGLGNTIAGLLGSFAINTCSPSVAISGAIGATARRIAFVVGGIFIVIGLLPKVAIVFALMPRPVMAAALMFATCFILINGMQMITSRMMDARKTLVIGLANLLLGRPFLRKLQLLAVIVELDIECELVEVRIDFDGSFEVAEVVHHLDELGDTEDRPLDDLGSRTPSTALLLEEVLYLRRVIASRIHHQTDSLPHTQAEEKIQRQGDQGPEHQRRIQQGLDRRWRARFD